MEITVSAMKKGFLRLDEARGGSLTMHIRGTIEARIVFMYVPDRWRRRGIGTALIEAAEREAARRRVGRIFCDFCSTVEGLDSFFKKNNFIMKQKESLISVQIDELLSSKRVLKSLERDPSPIESWYLYALLDYQIDELVDYFHHLGFPVLPEQFEHYDIYTSCVAYDPHGHTRCALLTSLYEDELFLDVMLGYSKSHFEYMMEICRNFVDALRNPVINDRYTKLTMLTVNPNVVPMLMGVLRNKSLIQEKGRIWQASFRLKDVSAGEPLEESLIDPLKWIEEISRYPYQRNINEKCDWIRLKKTKEKS